MHKYNIKNLRIYLEIKAQTAQDRNVKKKNRSKMMIWKYKCKNLESKLTKEKSKEPKMKAYKIV